MDEETNENQEENGDINVNDNNVSDPDENTISALGAQEQYANVDEQPVYTLIFMIKKVGLYKRRKHGIPSRGYLKTFFICSLF